MLSIPLISGCSAHNSASLDQAIDRVATQQQSLRDELTRLETDLVNSSRSSEQGIAELSSRIDKLEARLQSQQAQIAALADAIDKLEKRHSRHDGAKNARRKAAPKRTQAGQATNIKVQPQAEAGMSATTNAEMEKNIYTSAYLALKSGHYEEASRGFTEQLEKFPNGEYADQAWYWLGESLLAQKKQKEAIASFERVVQDYPSSVKHAAALLKLGQIHQAMGQARQAADYFKRILIDHPDSNAADLARTALAELGGQPAEGR